MRLIALRPEYQLTVDSPRNRIFCQHFEPMRRATALPHYRADWTAALAEVQPGFSILSDMQVTNHGNPALATWFKAVEQLIVQHGVSMVAEIVMPGANPHHYPHVITTAPAMPVCHFLTLWDAVQFLDELETVPVVGQ